MGRQQRGWEPRSYTDGKSRLKIVIRRRASKCMKEGAGFLQLICSVCFQELISCVVNRDR